MATILILEQEFNLANGLKAMLEKEGYGVLTDFSFLHQDELGCASKLDLIIININIPKELGLSILRKAKDNFITKPFEVGHLKKRVEELIIRKNKTIKS
ncbi:MAG: hypothetical protein WBI28_00050 [Candidatus Omnitrophota bacterium]